jgi:transcriptional regulator with XRE-family HTH domain
MEVEMLLMAAKSLNDYREDRYMQVDDFVRFLGISLTTYYRILEGKRPRFSTMWRVAGKLGVEPRDIAEFARKPSGTEGIE